MGLAEDEKLAECVRQYELLYNKSLTDYKDKRLKDAHWGKIDEALGNPAGSSASNWTLLLNRYSRRRMALRAVNVSGQGAEQVRKANKDMEEYKFLSWYDAFVRPKKSRTNLPVTNDPTEEIANISAESVNDEPLSAMPETPQRNASPTPTLPTTKQKHDVMENVAKFLKYKMEKDEKREKKVDDADDVFGKMVAAELKEIPKERKALVKHEINNVLFKHKINLQQSTQESTDGMSNENGDPLEPTVIQPTMQDLTTVFFN